MIRACHIAIALCLTAATASAQVGCPRAEDARRPIVIDYADGLREEFRSRGEGVWQFTGYDAGEMIYRGELAQGVYLLGIADVFDGRPDPNSRVIYDYGQPPAALPVPSEGKRWHSDVKLTAGADSWREAQWHAYGALTEVDIGGCVYDMLPLLIAYDTGDGYNELIHYLPELGFGYLSDSFSDDYEGGVIDAVRIARLK